MSTALQGNSFVVRREHRFSVVWKCQMREGGARRNCVRVQEETKDGIASRVTSKLREESQVGAGRIVAQGGVAGKNVGTRECDV